ncbi:protein kinase [Shewanella woodyi]|uniref:protein kinase n=1 Tax=Shewanella woodyi TaxID=60961 RepID=UPI003749EEE0
MQTLEQLKSGQLKGATRLQLAENLSQFPTEIFALADSLEVLDLSNNQLDSLPDDFGCLKKLKILFLSNNRFTQLPKVIANCPKLEMIGFKANQIVSVAEDSLPKITRWLILTDNKLERLPNSIGGLYRLQKLALAGNCLTALPDTMANCHSLELARLSANQFTSLPDWLFQLPKLSWLAVAGNPLFAEGYKTGLTENKSVGHVNLSDIELGEQIGEGASGVIYRARWLAQPRWLHGDPLDIAVKLFKGEVTSDGYPSDELANCLQAGEHQNLIKVVAQIDDGGQLGLVMDLIPSSFGNLGLPPSLISCTRDTFPAGTEFGLSTIINVGKQMAETMTHLHQNGVSHGDLYAHNTMLEKEENNGLDQGADNKDSGSKDWALFGDFGAASNLHLLPRLQAEAMESVEVRAFGCLLDDMLNQVSQQVSCTADKAIFNELIELSQACMQVQLPIRPRFNELSSALKALQYKVQGLADVAI